MLIMEEFLIPLAANLIELCSDTTKDLNFDYLVLCDIKDIKNIFFILKSLNTFPF